MKRISESRQGRPTKMFRKQTQPTGLSAILFSLHTQLAPFAGAIVTLALIASAGLLYWMIIGPSRMPADFIHADQQGVEVGTAELPEFAPELPNFTSRANTATVPETTALPEIKALNAPWWDSDEAVAVATSAPPEIPTAQLQEEELVVSLEEPATEPPAEPTTIDTAEQTASPLVGPIFSTTSQPAALDFSKLGTRVRRQ